MIVLGKSWMVVLTSITPRTSGAAPHVTEYQPGPSHRQHSRPHRDLVIHPPLHGNQLPHQSTSPHPSHHQSPPLRTAHRCAGNHRVPTSVYSYLQLSGRQKGGTKNTSSNRNPLLTHYSTTECPFPPFGKFLKTNQGHPEATPPASDPATPPPPSRQ